MNWLLNMFSEFSDAVAGEDRAERDRPGRSKAGINENDSRARRRSQVRPGAGRRRHEYGEISDWDW